MSQSEPEPSALSMSRQKPKWSIGQFIGVAFGGGKRSLFLSFGCG